MQQQMAMALAPAGSHVDAHVLRGAVHADAKNSRLRRAAPRMMALADRYIHVLPALPTLALLLLGEILLAIHLRDEAAAFRVADLSGQSQVVPIPLDLPVAEPASPDGAISVPIPSAAFSFAPIAHAYAPPFVTKAVRFGIPLVSFKLTSGYGWRHDPFTGQEEFHAGIDLTAPFDSTVFSTRAGTVVFAGRQDSYGLMIEIYHGDGIVTRYAHLQKLLVARGESVAAHQRIGLLGSSGRSTGPHLHYEVLVHNKSVDPLNFFNAGRGDFDVSSFQLGMLFKHDGDAPRQRVRPSLAQVGNQIVDAGPWLRREDPLALVRPLSR